MQDQSLQQIINELPATFINKVLQETSAQKLYNMLTKHHCYNRKAVIRARIENINYLVSSV